VRPRMSELRDLVKRIEDATTGHPAFSSAAAVIANAVDHLSAIARVEEFNSGTSLADTLETSRLLTKVSLARRIYDLVALYPNFESASMGFDGSSGNIRIVTRDQRRYRIAITEE
jgi:hypothetical protein